MSDLDSIRLFPDYAGTTVWFPFPVPYAETSLSAELIVDLEAWEQSDYDGLADDLKWRSADLRENFVDRGLELAKRLAAEVGVEFTVHLIADDVQRDVIAATDATNPDAARAFRAIRRQVQTQLEEGARRRDAGSGWFARSPDGTIFDPRVE